MLQTVKQFFRRMFTLQPTALEQKDWHRLEQLLVETDQKSRALVKRYELLTEGPSD
jgi:hypothetical protein